MSNETVFFILGIGLVAMALVVSFVGLRFGGRFPGSRTAMSGVVGVFALVVVATAVFGWRNGEDEQAHRAEEAAHAAQETGGEEGEAEPDAVPAADGSAVFTDFGCSGCHTLEAAGSTAETGPNLDGALAGKDAAYIETSIVDPAAEVAEGFPPGIMPEDFGEEISPEQLDALVQYLVDSTGGSSS